MLALYETPWLVVYVFSHLILPATIFSVNYNVLFLLPSKYKYLLNMEAAYDWEV